MTLLGTKNRQKTAGDETLKAGHALRWISARLRPIPRIPGSASDYAVYKHTRPPRRDAMSLGRFVPASPCVEGLTGQGYPRPRSD